MLDAPWSSGQWAWAVLARQGPCVLRRYLSLSGQVACHQSPLTCSPGLVLLDRSPIRLSCPVVPPCVVGPFASVEWGSLG